MAFKIGSTTVINDNAQVDWARIINSIAVTGAASNHYTTSGSGNRSSVNGPYIEKVGNSVRLRRHTTYTNCNATNCNCDCRD